MATSTPRLGKLYSYLKGYETVQFTGSPCSKVQKSISDLLYDEITTIWLDHGGLDEPQEINVILDSVNKFLVKYYDRMRNLKDANKVALLAEQSKLNYQNIEKMVSVLLSGLSCPLQEIGFCPCSSSQIDMDKLSSLQESCPWYVPRKFCIITGDPEDDEGLIASFISFSYAQEYKYLALALLRLFRLFLKVGLDVSEIHKYQMSFRHICSLGKIYELMNPSGQVRQGMIDNVKSELTKTPLDRTTDSFREYDRLLSEVFEDIINYPQTRLAYVKDMYNALTVNKSFLMSKYDREKDVYCSMKSTAQSYRTGQKHSLLSSYAEVDQYKDLFQEYDDAIGFNSYYSEKSLSDEEIISFKAKGINNPGKFKIRIIFISDNPIQDRCHYIQRRTQKLLRSLRCDCSKDHELARRYLKHLTNKWALTSDINQKPGIYCFDFSNATDTLDQHLQYRVLQFVMGTPVANFWDTLSKLPKYVENVDQTLERVEPKCGQPQGLLASFELFSLAHHFIFLMDMKKLGFESYESHMFYRLVGDDSVCNSIEPEYEYYNEDNIIIDEAGRPRSIIEQVHFDICTSFAGFKVNYDKSDSTHLDSAEANLEIAKVSYRNGEFASPVPFRLVMNYCDSFESKLAVAIWRGERQEQYYFQFMSTLLTERPNHKVDPLDYYLIRSGIIPYLEEFADYGSLILNPLWVRRVQYAYIISNLSIGLSFIMISDKDRSVMNYSSIDIALRKLFGRSYQSLWDQLDSVDNNHKIFDIINRNEQLVRLLQQAYSYENTDDRFLSLACSTVAGLREDEELQEYLFQIHEIGQILKDQDLSSVNEELIFPSFSNQAIKRMSSWSDSLMTRGTTKRPREKTLVFNTIKLVLRGLDDILGYISPVVGDRP